MAIERVNIRIMTATFIVVVLVGGVFALHFVPAKLTPTATVRAEEYPQDNARFGAFYEQDIDNSGWHVTVFHDRDTGQEEVCYRREGGAADNGPSCFLTGRTWK